MRNKEFNVIRIGEESVLTNKKEIVETINQENHLRCNYEKFLFYLIPLFS